MAINECLCIDRLCWPVSSAGKKVYIEFSLGEAFGRHDVRPVFTGEGVGGARGRLDSKGLQSAARE